MYLTGMYYMFTTSQLASYARKRIEQIESEMKSINEKILGLESELTREPDNELLQRVHIRNIQDYRKMIDTFKSCVKILSFQAELLENEPEGVRYLAPYDIQSLKDEYAFPHYEQEIKDTQ